jgi:hypothetical protein
VVAGCIAVRPFQTFSTATTRRAYIGIACRSHDPFNALFLADGPLITVETAPRRLTASHRYTTCRHHRRACHGLKPHIRTTTRHACRPAREADSASTVSRQCAQHMHHGPCGEYSVAASQLFAEYGRTMAKHPSQTLSSLQTASYRPSSPVR